jgi:pimeloyl-ACP methyl ester carboxylesterase
MGHSLGGKVTTMAASGRRVHALLALDPVNLGSPITGYSDSLPDILPDQAAELRIPVGFMGETTNGGGLSPCAPVDENFAHFYAAATASPWAASWELEGADHIDFVDDTSGICTPCTACPDGPADDAAVRATVHTLAVAFMRRHLLGDASMEAWLTGASVPMGVRTMHRP